MKPFFMDRFYKFLFTTEPLVKMSCLGILQFGDFLTFMFEMWSTGRLTLIICMNELMLHFPQ